MERRSVSQGSIQQTTGKLALCTHVPMPMEKPLQNPGHSLTKGQTQIKYRCRSSPKKHLLQIDVRVEDPSAINAQNCGGRRGTSQPVDWFAERHRVSIGGSSPHKTFFFQSRIMACAKLCAHESTRHALSCREQPNGSCHAK